MDVNIRLKTGYINNANVLEGSAIKLGTGISTYVEVMNLQNWG